MVIPWAQKGWGSRWRKVRGGGKAACTREKLITKERRDHWSISDGDGCFNLRTQHHVQGGQNSLSVELNSLPTVLYKKLEESQPPRLIPQKPCTFDGLKSDTCHWIQNTIQWQLPKKNIFAGKIIVGHQATCYPREAGGGGGVYFPIMVYTGRLPRKGLGISLAEV